MTDVIEVGELVKIFTSNWRRRRTRAVDGLSLSVAPGEIYGFLGPNGAGKTTTLKVLLGLLTPTSGRVTVMGESPGRVEARRRIGFLPENPYFYDYLTGREFLDFYGRLFGLSLSSRRERIEALFDEVGLEGAAGRKLRTYSKGMLQRIGMAQALLNDPRLLILDEPQSGLDPAGRKQVREIILSRKARGAAVLFSSHILSDAEMICDRVGIVDRGRLVAEGRLDELLEGRVRAVEFQAADLAPEAMEDLRRRASSFLVSGRRVQFVIPGGEETVAATVDFLSRSGGKLVSVLPHRETLEEVFLREVGEGRP